MFLLLAATHFECIRNEEFVLSKKSRTREDEFFLEVNQEVLSFFLKNQNIKVTCSKETSLNLLKKIPSKYDNEVLPLLYGIFLIAQKYSDIPDCFFQNKDYKVMMDQVNKLENPFSFGSILKKHKKVLQTAYSDWEYSKKNCTLNGKAAFKEAKSLSSTGKAG